jgi:hypothetical protein
MNWSRISSIAEIVSSVAILITLIYLATEVRQNTAAIQADAVEVVMQGDVEWIVEQVDDPNLNILLHKTEQLTEIEASQMHAYLVAFMRIKEAGHRLWQSGVLDDRTWRNYQSSIVNGPLATTQGRRWWANHGRSLFDPDLSALITASLEDAPLPLKITDYFLPTQNE